MINLLRFSIKLPVQYFFIKTNCEKKEQEFVKIIKKKKKKGICLKSHSTIPLIGIVL